MAKYSDVLDRIASALERIAAVQEDMMDEDLVEDFNEGDEGDELDADIDAAWDAYVRNCSARR